MDNLEGFITRFDDFPDWQPTKQADYITYFLTTEGGNDGVSATELINSFRILQLKEYKRMSAYLSEQASARKGRYVKVQSGGYRLARSAYNKIEAEIRQEPVKVSVSSKLTDLVAKVPDSSEKDFLREAINCYRIEAYRAFIIMAWIVSMDHLQKYIFANDLHAFNAALSKSPDKKTKKIVNYDDFSDLPESKVIELARSANIISGDVRKLLDGKLGTRNSAAHPSGIKISGHKATEFAIDLIDNVLLKYS